MNFILVKLKQQAIYPLSFKVNNSMVNASIKDFNRIARNVLDPSHDGFIGRPYRCSMNSKKSIKNSDNIIKERRKAQKSWKVRHIRDVLYETDSFDANGDTIQHKTDNYNHAEYFHTMESMNNDWNLHYITFTGISLY